MTVRVNVYENLDAVQRNVIARVRPNRDLDYWNGNEWQNGGLGMHKGISKLKDGRYALLISSDYENESSYGYVISDEVALFEILQARKEELLKTKKFKRLFQLASEKNGSKIVFKNKFTEEAILKFLS